MLLSAVAVVVAEVLGSAVAEVAPSASGGDLSALCSDSGGAPHEPVFSKIKNWVNFITTVASDPLNISLSATNPPPPKIITSDKPICLNSYLRYASDNQQSSYSITDL